MEVLKNSEKFSVFKIREKNKNIILKIAHKDPKKILREVKLLKKLSISSNFYKSKIPKMINFGLVKKGLSKNKGFYKQDFINGFTFSQIIQKQKISKKNLNLLVKTLIKKFGKFHLIDPDATWNFNDPFFSLSRFIYTFPHDTMEFDKYVIYSENFIPGNNKDKMNFKCKILWKKEVLYKYNVAFNKFFHKNFKINPLFKNLSELEFLRYNLTIILCFIRGINSNYEQKINFLNKTSSIFQNKSIYLYLLTLRRLKNFLDNKYD